MLIMAYYSYKINIIIQMLAQLFKISYIQMVNWQNAICLFLIGLHDSLSINWVKRLLLVTHPTTKKIHPSSYKLLHTFKETFVQVFIFLISIPALFKYFQQEQIGFVLSTLFLLLTYGYLFFYNTQILASTKQLALWAQKFPTSGKAVFPPMDVREKSELFYTLSNTVKSFIFLLLYYTPILLSCLILTSFFPIIGTICLVISESFFNSTFYFLKKWPYDQYNIAFMERNLPYMLGYGFTVSFVTNVLFTGDIARGLYFIISQWMFINAVLYSPPENSPSLQLQSKQANNPEGICFSGIASIIFKGKRSKFGNAYNIHRQKIRNNKQYRGELISNIVIMRPALKITEFINSKLALSFQKETNN